MSSASSPLLDFRDVSRSFTVRQGVLGRVRGEVRAVDGVSLSVRRGETLGLVGESGCGKSTLARMAVRLLPPTGGEILFDGESVLPGVPGRNDTWYSRRLQMIFQDPFSSLNPRLRIGTSIAEPLMAIGAPSAERQERVGEILRRVGLQPGHAGRYPHEFSGGQRQRVAIARAIVNEPEILLLDEPLGALDYKMRKEMQLELKLMHEQLGITFIFVTHDQEEALTMSDKIVVMSNGEIQQVGTPEEIYDEPKNAFVADFIGESNIFNGVMTGHKKVSFCQTEFDCVDDIKEGLRVQAVIRPEDVVLTEAGKGKLQGEVLSSIFKGTFHEITVLHNEKDEIVAQASGDIAKGTKVGVDILPDSIHLMHFNEKANHFTGMIDDAMRIRLVDGSIKVDMTKLFPGSTLQDGVLYDKSGHLIETEGRKVVVYINPRQAQLSDDPQVGLVQGHIDSLIYMGDHYSYEVRSSNDELYFVYDEYLWNIGDYVSVVVPDTGISVTLAE